MKIDKNTTAEQIDKMTDDEIMEALFDPCFRCGERGALDKDRICDKCNYLETRGFCETMLDQFGGPFALKMIGAKQLHKGGSGEDAANGKWRAYVTIKHMQGRDRVNALTIFYTWADTYTLVFYRGAKETKRIEDIYADQLQDLFERETGLFLTMGRRAS